MQYPISLTVNFLQNYKSEYRFKLKHLDGNIAEIYIYLPFTYNDLTYSITGVYSSFVRHNERLDSEPTGDKDATVYNVGDIVDFSDADANNYVKSGTYRITETVTQNLPVSEGNGTMIVFTWGNDQIVYQIYVHYDGLTWCRIKWYSNGFSTWKIMTG